MLVNFYFKAPLQASCEQNFPQDVVTLSNGKELLLPSKSSDFSMISLIGLVNLKHLEEILLPLKLYPIKLNNHGVALVSFYDYKKSDMGVFREFYIVVLATRNPTNNYQTFWQLLRSIRTGTNNPEENIVFHHLMASSDSEFGRLASSEIWGIPSYSGKIDLVIYSSRLSFPLRKTQYYEWYTRSGLFEKQSVKGINREISASATLRVNTGGINVHFENDLIYNPLGLNYYMYASGFNGVKLVRSPVMACGSTYGSSWGKNDILQTSGVISSLLQFLKFQTIRKEVGEHLRAVQFAPEKDDRSSDEI